MRFLISSTFTDSLASLDSQSQALVKQSAFDFQLNPQNPGFQFHRVTQAKEKNFWSFRVNRDVRIIVYKDEATFIICYADHHDAAYAWAERRRLEVHPETGAAQLVELQERIEEVVQRVYKHVEQETPLFDRFESDYLLALGVPTEWLDAVRYVGDSGFVDLIGVLPEEAAEHLMQLHQGQPVPRPIRQQGQDPFTHPDAQRRFLVVDQSETLLQQALDAPWEKWLTFLHPSQRNLVERPLSGPARVTGGAGTGKTVVALHRTAHLAQANPEAKILLTTYSTTLAARLKHNLSLLERTAPALQHVRVENLHRVARSLYSSLTKRTFNPVSAEQITSFLTSAIVANKLDGFSLDAVTSEWEAVIDERGIASWEDYKTASRAGRGTPLGIRQRLALWKVFERVQADLKNRHLMTYNQLCFELAGRFDARIERPFDHIIADEIQDFGAPELTLLRALTPPRPNDLFLCGDAGQRIYKGPASFLASGIDIRGRSTILRINYRTTEQIRRYADALLPHAIDNGDGDSEERHTVSLLDGVSPQLESYASESQEVAGVAEYVKAALSDGVAPGSIALFCRTNALMEARAVRVAEALGVPSQVLTDEQAVAPDRLVIGTMHRAKGLEFKVVVVLGCDADLLPLGHVMRRLGSDAERQEFIAKERHLLYVACTRARERLLVTAAGPASSFLQAAL